MAEGVFDFCTSSSFAPGLRPEVRKGMERSTVFCRCLKEDDINIWPEKVIGCAWTHLTRYLSLERLSLRHASSNTSIRYVPGVTLIVARRKSDAITTTLVAME